MLFNQKFRGLLLFVICFSWGGFYSVSAGVEVRIDAKPQQQMIYGMDFERLWHWNLLPEEAVKLAQYAVGDCRVSYVRVAIDAAAEFEEGQYDWDAYERQLACMQTLKDANPNIKFFASPRPIREAVAYKFGYLSEEAQRAPFTCYPFWVGVFEHPYVPRKRKFVEFRWEKAADYMVRHIQFFRGKGFGISYLDVKNENDRYYRPKELSQMVRRMREQLGADMPKVVAPSSHNCDDAIKWVEEAVREEVINSFDILASHNTKSRSTLAVLGGIARELDKSLWNTEMHGFQGPDDKAVANSRILWNHIRAGFGGLNDWLSIGNEQKTHKMFREVGGKLEVMRVYYIFKELVNTSGGGHYLNTNIPESLTSTAAFIRDGVITVWLLNASDEDLKDITVRFDGRTVGSDSAEVVWWDAENGRGGSRGKVSIKDGSSLISDIKANSLYCFSIKVK